MSEPIRILHVVVSMNPGGIENLLMNLYRQIDRNKIQFDFLLHVEQDCFFDEEIRSLGGRIYHVHRFSRYDFYHYLRVYKKFFQEHPEYKVIHSHLGSSSAYVIKASQNAHIPLRIIHSHSVPAVFKKWSKIIAYRFRTFCRNLSFIGLKNYYCFGCSQKALAWIQKDKKKTGVILKNGVNVLRFSFNPQERENLRQELSIQDKFVVGHIGSFTYPKNHEFLLDCFAELKKIKPNAFLILVGDGRLRPQIEEKIQQLGIQDSVLLTGLRKDTERFLQAMDVFLFPSRFEGLPVSVVEAQCSGLSCFISDVVTKEVAVSPWAHYLSLKQSPSDWAKFMTEHSSICEPRENGVEYVQKAGFDIQKVADWLTNFYLTELEKNEKTGV